MIKKSALAVVVAASMLPAAAMADTTVYGQARLFFVNQDEGTGGATQDAWHVESEASRLGVKGSAELDHGLEAIYKFEYEVDPAEGAGIGKNRNNYVGLKGDFGQVIIGMHDTPLKKAQGKIDQFNDYHKADIKEALDPAVEDGENRVSNIVYYKSPKIADAVNVHVAFIPGEQAGVSNNDGIADSTSIALTYKTDNLYLAIANDDFANDDKTTRLAAQFKSGPFGVGAIAQKSEDLSNEETAFVVSGFFKASDNVKLKAQVVSGKAETLAGVDGDETMQTTIGADYKLGKKTTAVAYFTSFEEENAGGTTIKEFDVFGLGLIHKF